MLSEVFSFHFQESYFFFCVSCETGGREAGGIFLSQCRMRCCSVWRRVAWRRSGDDPNPEVVPQLLQEDEGQHSVRNQPDPGWNKTLIKRQRPQPGSFS